MHAYKSCYLNMRQRGLSHTAAFALMQNRLGPLSQAHQETFLAWVKASKPKAPNGAAKRMLQH